MKKAGDMYSKDRALAKERKYISLGAAREKKRHPSLINIFILFPARAPQGILPLASFLFLLFFLIFLIRTALALKGSAKERYKKNRKKNRKREKDPFPPFASFCPPFILFLFSPLAQKAPAVKKRASEKSKRTAGGIR